MRLPRSLTACALLTVVVLFSTFAIIIVLSKRAERQTANEVQFQCDRAAQALADTVSDAVALLEKNVRHITATMPKDGDRNAACEALSDYFSSEVADKPLISLIYYGFPEGGLVLAGRRLGKDPAKSEDDTLFQDQTVGPRGEKWMAGNYYQFLPKREAGQFGLPKNFEDYFVLLEERSSARFGETETAGTLKVQREERQLPDNIYRLTAVGYLVSMDRLIRAFDRDLTIDSDQKGRPAYDAKRRPWYRAAKEKSFDQVTFSNAFQYFNGVGWGLSMLMRVPEIEGVAAVDMSLSQLQVILNTALAKAGLGSNFECCLIDPNAKDDSLRVLASYGLGESSANGEPVPITKLPPNVAAAIGGARDERTFSSPVRVGNQDPWHLVIISTEKGAIWTVLPYLGVLLASLSPLVLFWGWYRTARANLQLQTSLTKMREDCLSQAHMETDIAACRVQTARLEKELGETNSERLRLAAASEQVSENLAAQQKKTAQLETELAAAKTESLLLISHTEHDLRNSLNSLSIGLSNLGEKPDCPRNISDQLVPMREGLRHALSVITQGLDYDSEKPARAFLASICKVTISRQSFHAASKGMEVILEATDATSKTIFTYPVGLSRLIENLLHNAIRYCTEASATIRIVAEPTPIPEESSLSARPWIRISISTPGSPLSEELLEKVRGVYEKGIPTSEGFGLGLSICHRLLHKLQGAHAEVQRNISGFTVFSFCIPLAIDSSIEGGEWNLLPTMPPPAYLTKGSLVVRPNIWIVEDDNLHRQYLRNWLHVFANVLEFESGIQALERAKKDLPEFIIVDERLPGLTGCQTISRLRTECSYRGQAIIFTAAPRSITDTMRTESQVTAVVTKDGRLKPLLDQICSALDLVASSTPATQTLMPTTTELEPFRQTFENCSDFLSIGETGIAKEELQQLLVNPTCTGTVRDFVANLVNLAFDAPQRVREMIDRALQNT